MPVRIVEGEFYRTLDGRKVGPMKKAPYHSWCSAYRYSGEGAFIRSYDGQETENLQIYESDGRVHACRPGEKLDQLASFWEPLTETHYDEMV